MSRLVLTILVVLGLPARNKDLIGFVKAVIQKMTGNANFPSPTPTLAQVGTALADFETSETSMKTKRGVAGDRAAKRSALVTLMNHLRHHVQEICEADLENAAAIAESAGMRLRKIGARTKAAFTVVQGLVSGSVVCSVRAPAPQATYYWTYSLDQKSWTSVPETMTCTVTISGLAPGQTYYFRSRVLTRKAMSDFSQVVSLLVK